MHESGEMYLETMLILSKEQGSFRAIDISEHMGFSKPSVSRAVHILEKNGHIKIDGDGIITLTDSGREIAERIYDRHTTLADILVRLGVNQKTAVEDACRMEHYISDETLRAFKAYFQADADKTNAEH